MGRRPEFSLTQLLYFATIAETGNISEAAERLHASQSAVSAAIRRLERQLDNQLLVRHHAKGVSLTPAGKLLIDHARTILRQAQALNQYSSRLQGESAGPLDIASSCSITPLLIPRALSQVAASHPRLTVKVHDTYTPIDLLLNGTCELAVTYNIVLSEETRFTELVTPPMYALIAQSHPLAGLKTASLADLASDPIVMPGKPYSDCFNEYVESSFLKAGVSMPEAILVTGTETMRALVGAGIGFMLTPHRPQSMDTLDGSRTALVEITDDLPHLSIGVQILRDIKPTQRARKFVTALRLATRQIYTPKPANSARSKPCRDSRSLFQLPSTQVKSM